MTIDVEFIHRLYERNQSAWEAVKISRHVEINQMQHRFSVRARLVRVSSFIIQPILTIQ